MTTQRRQRSVNALRSILSVPAGEVHDVVIPVTGFEHEGVGAGAAIHQVVALAAVQDVLVFAAVHLIISGTAHHGVPAGLAVHAVIAALAVHCIVVEVAFQDVAAAGAVDGPVVKNEVVRGQLTWSDAAKRDLTVVRQIDIGVCVV